MRRLACAALAALTLAPCGLARADAGDDLSVFVLTMGPGDHPFYKFGHNAIWIRDAAVRRGWVFNFGTFDFASPALITDFLQGRLTYWLDVGDIDTTLAAYRHENRTIEVQELDLDAAQKLVLLDRLRINARPENKKYKYDYYLDNCSTRVRDALDGVLGGALRRSAGDLGSLNFRQHTLRLTADHPIYYALHIVLSSWVDRPIDRWAEMFLPEKVRDGLRNVHLGGPAGDRPLVKSERVLFQADRAPALAAPPSRRLPMLLVGLGLGAGLAGLGALAARRRLARAAFGIVVALLGTVLGFLGSFFTLVWLFTDHVVSHHNENILLCAPWALALLVLGLGVAAGSRTLTRGAFYTTLGAAGLALLGLALKPVPAMRQDNLAFVALLVPVWVGVAAGLRALVRAQTRTSPVRTPRAGGAAAQ